MPNRGSAMACMPTAPSRETNAQRLPTAGELVAMQMPVTPVRAQRPTMVNVMRPRP